VKLSSARLLEQCLTEENRGYVVERGLEKVVSLACSFTEPSSSVDQWRVATSLLENLFQHNEATCCELVKLGGLNAIIRGCGQSDLEILCHCVIALANLSLHGGVENQKAMIKHQVTMWLLPLTYHCDDTIKYYAGLTIAVLAAYDIEPVVPQSVRLNLFVLTHNPNEFAAHQKNRSKNWLQCLVPVLNSKKKEASNLAAFHFCMEAGIKKSDTQLFHEIGAIEPLKSVALSPNSIASKYAAEALCLIGEQFPAKLRR
jgi:hypothetical protein